ncbi:MAG: amidophosphoribosyltransferase [Myxococcota bacterium]|nr:amidophosphoribosyltransferase [Myxococcota bacterium]
MFDRFHDECGVFGVLGEPEAARLSWLGLHALQHRGQEGAGIAVVQDGSLRAHRGHGRVDEVFDSPELARLAGSAAVGHVRYGTAGGRELANVQPLVVRAHQGPIAIAHNGNLTNAGPLREQLERAGSLFAGTSDTEVILHLIASSRQETFVNRLVDALYQVEGAYSLVVLTADQLIAVRDPWGFRPLVLGRRGDAHVVASETCALELVDARYVREVAPGEMLIIDASGVQAIRPFPARPRRACIFEQIYFARPDSTVFGMPVYETRKTLGRLLARDQPARADVVIAVPDSGVPGAIGFAEASGLPFEVGLLRSHYVGRTFIEPTQSVRDLGVKRKLGPVRSVLEGRRVVVVDDSLVRGTTARKIVRMLRNCGASEVHLRITAPPTTGPCFYGVDTPEQEELIAHRMSVAEIQAYLGADSLGYLSLEALREAEGDGRGGFCEACFSGDYPVQPQGGRGDAQVQLFSESVRS